MLTKLSTKIFSQRSFSNKLWLWFLVGAFLLPLLSVAQTDSIVKISDPILKDSIFIPIAKSDSVTKKKGFSIDANIEYDARDSIVMDWKAKKAYLYGEAQVAYDEIILKAAYIEIDFTKNEVFAHGMPDSSGTIVGVPVFKDGDDEYKTEEIHYNFNSKKGLVSKVTKQEGESYIWLSEGKKNPDNSLFVNKGHFTTCSAEHPHFRIAYTKGKVIPNDKIVTGPIYLEIEDVPLPLVLPFGFFPNKKGRANGLIIPSYGYSENRGYNLTRGGYYWGLGPHADLAVTGDFYSRGSWGVRANSRYKLIYKYGGDFHVEFFDNTTGEADIPNPQREKTFNIRWSHVQDQKSNPNSNFSANVNFGSSRHNYLATSSFQERLNNSYSSSIAYTARLWQKYNLTLNLSHSQNNLTRQVNLTAPNLVFTTPRYLPFQRKKQIGSKKWYETIQLNYVLNAQNTIDTYDSLFRKIKVSDFRNGIRNEIPIQSTVNLGFVNWSNNINYSEKWYFNTTRLSYSSDSIVVGNDTVPVGVVREKVNGFRAARELTFSSSFSTRIYGMFVFKKGPIKALRHVISPVFSFSYHPDYGNPNFGYFKEYTGANGKQVQYSIFEGSVYGGPAAGKSGNVSLFFTNNLEMKVKSKKDTITGEKKIMLIESLTFGTAYNLAVDKNNLQPFRVDARTTLFKRLTVFVNGQWDFYGLDSNGIRLNKFYWQTNKKLMRAESFSGNLTFAYRFSADELKGKEKKKVYNSQAGTPEELNQINNNPDHYVDFNNQWSVDMSYSLNSTFKYDTKISDFVSTFTQTLNFSGDVNVTPKWKVGVTSGYDFQMKMLSPTSIDIYRDLHCWELVFNWVPIGAWKSYNLTIRVKATMLQDLKLNKKMDWQDY